MEGSIPRAGASTFFQSVAIRHPTIGSKRACVSCHVRFYDLMKTPAVCPKCGTAQPAVVPRTVMPRRGAGARYPLKVSAPVAEQEEDVAKVEVADEDDPDGDEDDVVEDDDEADIDPVQDEPVAS